MAWTWETQWEGRVFTTTLGHPEEFSVEPEELKEIYEHGLASGVQIAIEPINRFETYFINRGDQAAALAKAVGPECGVCLDVFHMNIEETDMFDTIREVGERVANFHVADRPPSPL